MSRRVNRFSIEVRYSTMPLGEWVLHSRHRSVATAHRAYEKAARAMPKARVQMRNDVDGHGVIRDTGQLR